MAGREPVARVCVILSCVALSALASPASAQVHYPTTPSFNARCELDRDQQDESVWPNALSSGNSDPWISQNHDRIRKMRPRVLVLNFANSLDMEGAKRYAENMADLLGESSRYHGYSDPVAPRFFEYSVVTPQGQT